MIVFRNIDEFDYIGEHYNENGKHIEQLSIPIEIDNKGLCKYPVPFTLYEMDKEYYPRIKPYHYDSTPFYSGISKEFTKEPKYYVPEQFREYLQKNNAIWKQNDDFKLKEDDELER